MLSGDAEVTIGDKTYRVSAPAVAYILRNTNHYVVNTGKVEFQYLYVTVWPQGIPTKEKVDGWRQQYTDIIQEYVDRRYSVDEGLDESVSGR